MLVWSERGKEADVSKSLEGKNDFCQTRLLYRLLKRTIRAGKLLFLC